ncbi:MAG: ribulose-phosphate 3-epimerase [Chlamydiales bacterium]|jgi:ribulose-phosphate 3-epimerase
MANKIMSKASIKISPSILAADFTRLGEEAKRVEDAGADSLHIDIMDGNFAPNLTLGPQAVAAINRSTDLFLDVHIMVYNPYDYVQKFVEAGADRITFHFEATEDVEESLKFIRSCGIEAGLAFNPETSPTLITRYLDKCDMVLLMTVKPGFCGQEFMPEVLEKIRFLRDTCDKICLRKGGVMVPESQKDTLPPFDIQVDGGINLETARQCVDAGANILVSGSHLFGAPDLTKAIQELREASRLLDTP